MKMKLKIKLIIAFIFSVLWATPAYAYLDPGTGSILLQGLLAGIATVITTLTFYWRRIKAFFSKAKDDPKSRM